jgi:hypothetical protein
MVYYKESEIRKLGSAPENIREAQRIEKALGDSTPQIFLSHSHYDKDLVRYAKIMLEGIGVSVYVDWEDESMPSVTCAATASAIKQTIRSHNKFIMLASSRALTSLWVPWELGYADGFKGANKIAVFPAADETSVWRGNEYMQLYSTIQVGQSNDRKAPAVFGPGKDEGIWLADWVHK